MGALRIIIGFGTRSGRGFRLGGSGGDRSRHPRMGRCRAHEPRAKDTATDNAALQEPQSDARSPSLTADGRGASGHRRDRHGDGRANSGARPPGRDGGLTDPQRLLDGERRNPHRNAPWWKRPSKGPAAEAKKGTPHLPRRRSSRCSRRGIALRCFGETRREAAQARAVWERSTRHPRSSSRRSTAALGRSRTCSLAARGRRRRLPRASLIRAWPGRRRDPARSGTGRRAPARWERGARSTSARRPASTRSRDRSTHRVRGSPGESGSPATRRRSGPQRRSQKRAVPVPSFPAQVMFARRSRPTTR